MHQLACDMTRLMHGLLTVPSGAQAHFIEGRKLARRQDGQRWIDTYKVPAPSSFVQTFIDLLNTHLSLGSDTSSVFSSFLCGLMLWLSASQGLCLVLPHTLYTVLVCKIRSVDIH